MPVPRVSPDDRPETEDHSPKAIRGTAKPDQNRKNGITWELEAFSSIRKGIAYLNTSAEWYSKGNDPEKGAQLRFLANAIKEQITDL